MHPKPLPHRAPLPPPSTPHPHRTHSLPEPSAPSRITLFTALSSLTDPKHPSRSPRPHPAPHPKHSPPLQILSAPPQPIPNTPLPQRPRRLPLPTPSQALHLLTDPQTPPTGPPLTLPGITSPSRTPQLPKRSPPSQASHTAHRAPLEPSFPSQTLTPPHRAASPSPQALSALTGLTHPSQTHSPRTQQQAAPLGPLAGPSRPFPGPTFLTAALKANSPASLRSSQIMGMRGTASIPACARRNRPPEPPPPAAPHGKPSPPARPRCASSGDAPHTPSGAPFPWIRPTLPLWQPISDAPPPPGGGACRRGHAPPLGVASAVPMATPRSLIGREDCCRGDAPPRRGGRARAAPGLKTRAPAPGAAGPGPARPGSVPVSRLHLARWHRRPMSPWGPARSAPAGLVACHGLGWAEVWGSHGAGPRHRVAGGRLRVNEPC